MLFRSSTLAEYGFRLPSCMDNRPLKFEEWDLIEERITPEGYTYFDPTAIPIDEKIYLVVGSAAPNVMGDREHLLFTAELILP